MLRCACFTSIWNKIDKKKIGLTCCQLHFFFVFIYTVELSNAQKKKTKHAKFDWHDVVENKKNVMLKTVYIVENRKRFERAL
jgi:hypothetical protein